VVSAYASGRKGAEEAERRAGGGVEHRARDKQVGGGMGSRGTKVCGARVVSPHPDLGTQKAHPVTKTASPPPACRSAGWRSCVVTESEPLLGLGVQRNSKAGIGVGASLLQLEEPRNGVWREKLGPGCPRLRGANVNI
jgi:hypothetical protein